jgi:hypothetical protein
VVLGDGAAWIWNTATELFPQATQILDRFHAKEHLGKAGKAIYGDSMEAKKWIQQRYDELDQGRLAALVQELHGHAGKCKDARDCIHYFWNNRQRMRYPKFHRQGLCTSSGVVEAGCKVVIGTRLKRAGMHWTVKGGKRYHRPAMQQTRWTLRGLLGVPLRSSEKGRMTSHKSDVHPR